MGCAVISFTAQPSFLGKTDTELQNDSHIHYGRGTEP